MMAIQSRLDLHALITYGYWRGRVPRVRSEIAELLIKEIGMSLAGVVRSLAVSTSAISKILHGIAQESRE